MRAPAEGKTTVGARAARHARRSLVSSRITGDMRPFVGVDLEGLADGVADPQAPFRDLPGLTPTDPE